MKPKERANVWLCQIKCMATSDFRGSMILLYNLLVYYANAPQESFTDFSLFLSLMIKYFYSFSVLIHARNQRSIYAKFNTLNRHS